MSTNLRKLIDEVSKQKRHSKKCDDNIDIFWKEIDDFTNHSDPYSFQSGWFANDYAQYESSHIWHEMHFLLFTWVLSFVACIMMSKQFGIGSAERSWSDVKMIEDGKRSNLGNKSVEKRANFLTNKQIWMMQISIQ